MPLVGLAATASQVGSPKQKGDLIEAELTTETKQLQCGMDNPLFGQRSPQRQTEYAVILLKAGHGTRIDLAQKAPLDPGTTGGQIGNDNTDRMRPLFQEVPCPERRLVDFILAIGGRIVPHDNITLRDQRKFLAGSPLVGEKRTEFDQPR